MALSTLGSFMFMGAAVLLGFLIYMAIKDKIFGTEEENFEQPGKAALEILPTSYSPPKTVAASGPSPPAQESPPGEVVIHAGPAPRDPLADEEEASDAKPTVTYPERYYRPAPPNDQDGLAYEAGIAGPTAQTSAPNLQKFGLDMIQNGGELYNGIYANDTTENHNFSSF
jgi:hypothetical protein